MTKRLRAPKRVRREGDSHLATRGPLMAVSGPFYFMPIILIIRKPDDNLDPLS
jgi:hypothetical protein